MSAKRIQLTKAEIAKAFREGNGAQIPVILSTEQLAALVSRSPKTIYEWVALGYLDGTFRKRGNGHLFWRDRVIQALFNGPEWTR